MAGAIIGTEGGPIGWLLGATIGASIGATVSFFEALFGGSSDTPPTPRKLLHGRHPLYPVILGIQNGLIPDEASAGAPKLVGDPQPSPNARPLQKDPSMQKELCQQAALTRLEKCIGENSALIIGAASLPCEGAVLAGPQALASCEGIMEALAVPPLVGAVCTCISQYRQEVRRCGQ